MLKLTNSDSIKNIKRFLDRNYYHEILKSFYYHRYYIDSIEKYNKLEVLSTVLNDLHQQLINLLVLGKPVEIKDVENLIESSIIDDFINCGILEKTENKIQSTKYVIISVYDNYIVTDIPYLYPTCKDKVAAIYIGADSYRLMTHMVKNNYNNALDLCSGSGIQGFVLARYSKKVVCVEIQKEASVAIKFNSILNDIEDKIDVRQGSLFDVIEENEKFDYVVSNPPFIAVPENVEYPIPGDGGPDGMDIIRIMLEKLDHHLCENGRATFTFEALGNHEKMFFSDELESYGKSNNIDVMITQHARSQIDFQTKIISKYTSQSYKNTDEKDLYNQWNELYKGLGAEFLYSITLNLQKSIKNPSFNIINLCNTWKSDSAPSLKKDLIIKPHDSRFGIWKDDKRRAIISNDTYEFIQALDGNISIMEIVKNIYPKFKDKYSSGESQMLNSILDLCSIMEGWGLIKK